MSLVAYVKTVSTARVIAREITEEELQTMPVTSSPSDFPYQSNITFDYHYYDDTIANHNSNKSIGTTV